MSLRPFPLPVCLLILATAGAARAAGSVDQEYVNRLGGSMININGDFALAQTFTVGESGLLDRVEAQAETDEPLPPSPAILEVRRTVNGVPDTADDAVLARVLVPAAHAPTSVFGPSLLGADLGDQAVPVTAGDVLAVSLRSDSPPGRDYKWIVADLNRYPRGEVYIRSPFTAGEFIRLTDADPNNAEGLDGGFRTFVTVPEPGAGVLLLGLLPLLGRRGRGRRVRVRG